MSITSRAEKMQEVTRNFAFFSTVMDDILKDHSGQYALIRQQKFVDFFESSLEAQTYAFGHFTDGLYSIQKVANEPVNLGYYSYVDDYRAP